MGGLEGEVLDRKLPDRQTALPLTNDAVAVLDKGIGGNHRAVTAIPARDAGATGAACPSGAARPAGSSRAAGSPRTPSATRTAEYSCSACAALRTRLAHGVSLNYFSSRVQFPCGTPASPSARAHVFPVS